MRIKLDRARKKQIKRAKELEMEEEEDDDELDNVIPLAEVTDDVDGSRTTAWDPKLTFQVQY